MYEEDRNNFLVIDGQQRLLTLYFFAKGRFPRPKIRGELREHLQRGFLDEDLLEDNEYFEPFKLLLSKSPTGRANKFHGLTYKGLKEDRTSLDLRTIRNTVVKQTSPQGNSAVFEIFSRLNTGGVNLTPQEIRASLYHSPFFARVIDLNSDPLWRHIVGTPKPDPRMRDTEFLLRSLALSETTGGFSGSLANFINGFCLNAKKFETSDISAAIDPLVDFFHLLDSVESPFMRSGRFSGVLFESAYAAWGQLGRPTIEQTLLAGAIVEAKQTEAFAETLQEGSTKPVNIRDRIGILREAIKAVV